MANRSAILAAAASALMLALIGAAPAPDAATRAWWALTTQLSNDAMEGRDTGSAGYARAADVVAARLRAAGLGPLGDGGSYLQRVPMERLAVDGASLSVAGQPVAFLREFTVAPTLALPPVLDARLAYRGYCARDALAGVKGRVVICHGTRREGLPTDAERLAALKAAGAVGMITITDPGFTVEPPTWPLAYARSVWIQGSPPPRETLIQFRLNADALDRLIAGSSQGAAALVASGAAGGPLPSFDPPGRLHAAFRTRRDRISSPNVVAMLPGTDPAVHDQAIVLSAHLDGYGVGEPVRGDRLYNGTLDDAAYVALLVRLAEGRRGKGYRRPVIIAAFTGEEKGLLGARWFVAHPPVPKPMLAADINLDQLRPIFPLELLTVHALDDSSLGSDARAVASAMGIAVQHDPEPVRNLLRRADHWPFIEAGIPATGFVFGYRPGTPSERIYRTWYKVGYHRPQDDPAQPIDWQAARDFNRFFFALVARVADKQDAPRWSAGSRLRPSR